MLLDSLRGIVGGKHRLHQCEGKLVCPALGMPTSAASNLRECADCGQQVMVAVGVSCALVDAGRLHAICPRCWEISGKTLAMHPEIEAELERKGLRERGWRRLGELNTERDGEPDY